MRTGRVDYRMARRATLRDVRSGLRTRADVCDAHPELLRAAKWIGEPVGDCPLCDTDALVHVTYVFPRYGKTARRGQAVTRESLPDRVRKLGDLAVYTVEACRSCGWHHLVEKYDLLPPKRAVGG
ncbi:DUF5318 family protein [Salsipaludibacter albus]|uniref:DUF5318 family protein n=1 Tax=Salsipaludibacter albus TaxID=2849650 RepID=UPI001EE46571|nr:DUF5318 family protein [Salsipaludibacter albus]